MKISGFTFIRNATLYDFPIVESIMSVLPLVDELIVVAGDSTDNTNELISSIDSDKIRVIHTVWDASKFHGGAMLYAEQTDIALKACEGDWCVYIQSDEVLHESALPKIREACHKYYHLHEIEGFVLDYVHMYADYQHYIDALHFAYPAEIRIVRGSRGDIHSWRDAQSFRVMPNFDGVSYDRYENTRKLRCVHIKGALMFHYGWSRDPRAMVGKQKLSARLYSPEGFDGDNSEGVASVDYYDYGNLSHFPLYKKSQPKIMKDRASSVNWLGLLRYTGKRIAVRKISAPKYRILSFIENKILSGRRIGGFSNYEIVEKFNN